MHPSRVWVHDITTRLDFWSELSFHYILSITLLWPSPHYYSLSAPQIPYSFYAHNYTTTGHSYLHRSFIILIRNLFLSNPFRSITLTLSISLFLICHSNTLPILHRLTHNNSSFIFTPYPSHFNLSFCSIKYCLPLIYPVNPCLHR